LPGDAPKSRFERVQALSTLDIAPAEDKPSHEVGVFEHTISNGREGITETCSEKVEDKRTAKFVNTLGRIFRTRLARHGEA
jgi:hypothetical protein